MSKTNSVDLLHPELLSNEMIIEILNERKVKLNDLKEMNREKLIGIYQQFCLPHAQRKKNSGKSTPQNDQKMNIKTNGGPTVKHFVDDKNMNSSQAPKRIKLNNDGLNHTANKRKLEMNDTHDETIPRKQKTKITWP